MKCADPLAFRDQLVDTCDIRRISQSAGTLRLATDAKGLRYTITVNEKDTVAVSVGAKIGRRDVTGSSFWFEPMSEDDEEWTPGARGGCFARAKGVKLIELGPVALPAYPQATVALSDTRSPEALQRLRATRVLLASARAKARRF